MKEESFLITCVKWILRRMNILEKEEVSKSEMCEQAQSVCNHDCGSCAWGEVKEE